MLLVVLMILAAVIVALVVTTLTDRRRNPRRETGLLRAGEDDAADSRDAGNSAINKASWMRPGGF